MSRYLLGVVTQSLRGGSPAQRPIFNHAIECTRALLEFYIYARYKSHDDATLSYMEDALHRFHTFKDVFLLGRAGKKAKPKANALRTELGKKRKVDEETNADTWTPSKKRRKMNAWRDYVTSAECNSVRKPYANLSDTPVALASAFKCFQMLPAPPVALQNALRLCKSILTCS
jgi:hypothetical protein